MDIPSLLFSPNGRIDPRDFGRGVILLTGFLIIAMTIEAFAPPVLSGMFSLLTVATVYCYLCVYGKRLHDTGRSAWYFLAVFAGFLIVTNIVNGILLSIFAPEAVEATEEMWTLLQRGNGQEAMEKVSAINKMTIIPRMITILAANALFAYLAVRLRSDPDRNVYGPPAR